MERDGGGAITPPASTVCVCLYVCVLEDSTKHCVAAN